MTVTRRGLLTTATSVAWVALVLMTLTAWWLGTDHGVSDAETASVLVLVVAFLKVRLVGLYFMELRHAPLVLRGLFEGWCWVVCAAILTMYVAL